MTAADLPQMAMLFASAYIVVMIAIPYSLNGLRYLLHGDRFAVSWPHGVLIAAATVGLWWAL